MTTSSLRVAIDATPLAGTRTGIGRYVERLVDELGRRDDVDVRLAAFTLRHRGALRREPARLVHRPVPARLLQRAWLRGDVPSAELVMGRADVAHGTNFVLPPPRSAAGVVTIHDLTFERYPELVDSASLAYRTLVPRAVAKAARVLTPTRAVADEVCERYGLPTDRIVVTPLGVGDAWFDARRTAVADGIPDDYLLAVGTIEPRKGLDVLLDAYRLLISRGRDVPPLVLVGAAGWGPRLDLAGLAPERVVPRGFVDEARLIPLVAGARMLVFPSRYEGFGLPPLEALACGTPVVASDIAAIREVVGGHVRLTTPGDADALADAIERELAEPATVEQRAAGQEHARSFTWQRCAELTVAAYRSAVG